MSLIEVIYRSKNQMSKNNLYVVTYDVTLTGQYKRVMSGPNEQEVNDLAQDEVDASLCKGKYITDCEVEVHELELPHINTNEETYTLYKYMKKTGKVSSKVHIADSWIKAIGCYLAAFEHVTGESRKIITSIHRDETYDSQNNLIDYGGPLDVLGNDIEYP